MGARLEPRPAAPRIRDAGRLMPRVRVVVAPALPKDQYISTEEPLLRVPIESRLVSCRLEKSVVQLTTILFLVRGTNSHEGMDASDEHRSGNCHVEFPVPLTGSTDCPTCVWRDRCVRDLLCTAARHGQYHDNVFVSPRLNLGESLGFGHV